MHEVIKIARRRIICERCGLPIQKGERFRFIWLEYGGESYYEHISCPKATAVVTLSPEESFSSAPKPTIVLNMA